MITKQPTKKQLAALERIGRSYDEESSYLMLANGTALAALYKGDRTRHAIVRRDGSVRTTGTAPVRLHGPV